MNLPNKLTVFRLILVPFCVAAVVMPESVIPAWVSAVAAAIIFAAASFTDMLDGRIARKYGLVTDFGKFLDPLADKFMVIGTMMAIVYRNDAIRPWFFWLVLCVIFREFAVTSLRLMISSSSGEVVAAAMPGKIKTVLQMFTVLSALLEPVFAGLSGAGEGYYKLLPVTLCLSVLALLFTLWSGIDYFVSYAKKKKTKETDK